MKLYNLFNKIEYIGYRLKTALWYKFFLKSSGAKCAIYKPIYINPAYISLGKGVLIRNNSRIECLLLASDPSITIDDNVNIEQNLHLTCGNKIHIGQNTAIAANVTITDIKHSYEDVTISPKLQALVVSEVIIGAECTIYNNSVILPGTILGKHCSVAANSVVLGKIYPDYCILAGNPAIIVKRYSPQAKSWLKTTANGDFIN